MDFKGPSDALLVLGIDFSCSREEVKNAYRELMKIYHPDAKPSPDTAWQYFDINDAYEYLMAEFDAAEQRGVTILPEPTVYGEGTSSGGRNGVSGMTEIRSGTRIIGDAEAAKRRREAVAERTAAKKKEEKLDKKRRSEEELEKRHADAVFERTMEKIHEARAAAISAEIISAMLKGELK